MVHAPVANGLRESRHVAVYGLPQTLTDENLHRHFARFGPIQGLSRPSRDVLHITFMDSRSAGIACKGDTMYDKDTPYRITYYHPEPSNRHSMASVPSTPTFPSHSSHSSPRHVKDHRSPQRSQIERNGPVHHHPPPPPPPPPPKDPTEHWPYPTFPSPDFVCCVVYEIKLGVTPEKEAWDVVKARAKRAGDVGELKILNLGTGAKRFAAFYTKKPNLDLVNSDTKLLLGKPPLFKIYFPPASNGYHPSTSNGHLVLKGDALANASYTIRLEYEKKPAKEDIYKRFKKYGHIYDVEVLSNDTNDGGPNFIATIHFTNIEDAHVANNDPQVPRPMQTTTRPQNRIIISHLPPDMNAEQVEYVIRRASDEVAEIKLDLVHRKAVITYDSLDVAKTIVKGSRHGSSNFGDYRVNYDFCSDKVFHQFEEKKKLGEENLRKQKQRDQSSSRDQENRRESIGPKSSVEELELYEDYNEASSSNHVNNSGSSVEEEEDDDDNRFASRSRRSYGLEFQDTVHRDDENLPGPSHEPEELKPKLEELDADPTEMSPHLQNGTRYHKDLASRMSQPSTSYGDRRTHMEERVKRSTSFMPILPRTFDKEPKEEIKTEDDFYPSNRPVDYYKVFARGPKYNNSHDEQLTRHIDRVVHANTLTRAKFEKLTGRPFPNLNRAEDLSSQMQHVKDSRNYYRETSDKDIDIRIREWKKLQVLMDRKVQDYQLHDFRELPQNEKKESVTHAASTSSGSGRPSMDETTRHRLSFDATHHPAEITQRSQSLCIGPMTPSTPYPQPLQVNTNQHPGFSIPSGSGLTTPKTTQPPPILMSPVSRHNSMSSTGRPACIQTLRHQSVILPDLSVPPPAFPPFHEDLRMIPSDPTSSRRSSETLAPLKSPPFVNHNLPSMSTMPPNLTQMTAVTGTGSVSSSAHSTPRHSISGTPVHYEPPSTSKGIQAPPTPKTSRPEKVQVRHDSISKPGPSNVANALQARSQSMTGGDPRKSTPSTPVVRDAGSDLIAQIMSNEPNQRLKKLPRIEKKPSALQNVHGQHPNPSVTTPTTPSGSLNQAMLLKDKEREKERRRKEKERELEKEREARKEMKKKETKEERLKRREMERKREEDERRERKREKQRIKEKEERRKEKEKERRKAEKEKLKKKKHRKDEDSEDSESTSDDELDLDRRKPNKELTQEERDHQLALILSRGSIIENLKSRRTSDKPKSSNSLEKVRKGEHAGTPRRVLIESSDEENTRDGDDDDKEKSDSESEEGSDTELQFMQPTSTSTNAHEKERKNHKKQNHKDREKGELSSSSSEDEENQERDSNKKQRIEEDRENRKRQKSLTNYSSDDSRRHNGKKARNEGTENARHNNSHKSKDDSRKRRYEEEVEEDEVEQPKAKRQAVKKIPSLEMVDISDTELTPGSSVETDSQPDRIRTQSTSSTSSAKNEKQPQTPIRVVPPPLAISGTPLQSPKILSPKILSPKLISPKPSTSKRSSIASDTQENPLISPRPRNRTTSSTSSISKHEVSSVPEARQSPPVTAKTSVSSIEDFSTREGFSSAAASPMSASGRPMVLTKAAMKAFNNSPPKKQSSSSGPHDSSDSDSSSSSSGSSSSEDDSDDENAAIVEQLVNSAGPIVIPASVIAPAPVVTEEEVFEEPIDVQEEITVASSPAPSVEPSEMVLAEQEEPTEPESVAQEEELNSPMALEKPVEDEKEMVTVTSSDIVESAELVEPEEKVETVEEPVETSLAVVEEEVNVEKQENEIEEVTEESEPEPVVEKMPSPEPMERESTPETSNSPKPVDSPSAHTIISDQETDQAVQSIFDEEEADEFPQYPDFVMPNDDKVAPEKDMPKPVSAAKKSSRSTMSSESSSVDTLMSPKTSTSQSEIMQEKLASGENSERGSAQRTTSVEPETAPSTSSAPTVELKRQESRYMDDSDDDYGDKPLKIAESSPERTPTPQLVHTEKIQEISEQPEMVAEKIPEKATTPESAPVAPVIEEVLVQAPVPPQAPLEVSVPSYQQQVIQPSPRPAVTPVSQSGQPVSVVQPPQPSPAVEKSDNQLVLELISAGRLDEIAARMSADPTFRDRIDAPTIQLLQKMFSYHAEIANQPVEKAQAAMMAQQHHELATKNALARQEQLKYYKQTEDENLKRQQREQLDRKMEMDRQEKKRRGDTDRMNLANAQKAAAMAAALALAQNQNAQIPQQQKPDPAFLMTLMPAEASSFYGTGRAPSQSPLVNGSSSQVTPRPSSTASSTTSVRTPLQPSASVNQISRPEQPSEFQRWFYNIKQIMSSDESATSVATVNPTPPSTADLASILQQIQASQAAQHVPVVTTASASNPLANLEALLNTASLANLAGAAAFNPLSMLALTSQLNQANPVYQGIARVLLTMNMGQMLANQQTNDLLALNQQETLMSLLAAKNGSPFSLPQLNQQQQQQPAVSQGGFAIPQGLPMSLKRSNKDPQNMGDRKKACPPLAQQPVSVTKVAPPPPPPRTPTPPHKAMFENLPPEMKEKNEIFRKEILRRLDIILLEELGADDEEPDVKPDLSKIPTSEEDIDDSKTDSVGSETSAFRRIPSRSSTINNSSSPSASRTTTPSTSSSLSSGPDSPPLEGDSLSSEFMEMLTNVAAKHREGSRSEALSAKIVDEAALTQHFPMVWTGRLALKSTETNINLHLINGSETFLNGVLGRQLNEENPRRDSVKILQRLRLDNGQVEHIYGILTNPEYACCLALSSCTSYGDLAKNESNLKASFIDYLTKKQIAGISSLAEVEQKFRSARVHVFAPGEIVNKYLSELATNLHDYLQNTETRYLLIVFTNDKVDPNMDGPPPIASLAVPPISSS